MKVNQQDVLILLVPPKKVNLTRNKKLGMQQDDIICGAILCFGDLEVQTKICILVIRVELQFKYRSVCSFSFSP